MEQEPKSYIVYRNAIYREKLYVVAESKEEAIAKALAEDYEDCMDMEFIDIAQSPMCEAYPD